LDSQEDLVGDNQQDSLDLDLDAVQDSQQDLALVKERQEDLDKLEDPDSLVDLDNLEDPDNLEVLDNLDSVVEQAVQDLEEDLDVQDLEEDLEAQDLAVAQVAQDLEEATTDPGMRSPAADVNSVASKALCQSVPGLVHLRVPSLRSAHQPSTSQPFCKSSRAQTGTSSVRADTGVSTTPSVRRFANDQDFSGIRSSVTSFTSVIGTNGWKSTPCTSSLVPSCSVTTAISPPATGLSKVQHHNARSS